MTEEMKEELETARESKKEMEPKKETQVATTSKRKGFEEGVNKDDLLMPRAKLLQGLSPELADHPDKFHAGQIINSLTLDVLPDVFIPIFMFTFWMRFNPRDPKAKTFDANFGPGDMLWRSKDPFDPKVVEQACFGPNGERPLATKFMNFFSHFPGVKMPVVISFSNTSFKAGKRLLSLARFADVDMFALKYTLKCKQETKPMGTYHIFVVEPAGKTEGKELEKASQWWDEFSTRTANIQVHDEGNPEAASTEERPF